MDLIDGYREFKLDNGLFVALKETNTETIFAKLKVWHGYLNENSGEEGLAHFLEHNLMMGGSKKYTPKQVDKTLGEFGEFGAGTGSIKTSFSFDMIPEDVELYLNFISDSIFNPRLDKERFEEERKIVLREIADYKSCPTFDYDKAHAEAFFGKLSPHIYSGLGRESVIKNATTTDLKKFHERGYSPNNMNLIIVGKLPKNIESLVKENFGKFKPGRGKKFKFPKNKKLNDINFIHMHAPELLNNTDLNESSAQLNFSFAAPTKTDPDSYSARLLSDVLGGDSNSSLFQNIRQRQGLVYYIRSNYNGELNKGVISINSFIQATQYKKAIDSIFKEIHKLQNDLVSTENLKRIKKAYKYRALKSLETNEDISILIELKKEDGLTNEIFLEGMNAVTPESIREAARKYFPTSRSDGNYVLSLRDPLKK